MDLATRFANAKRRLLNDESICSANRRLFAAFFEYEEYKLKRMNGLARLDEPTYKTLLDYVSRLRTVNRWFENKPWEQLTKEEIKQVYDGVEDGHIQTKAGTPFKDAETYYRRILRGKPFILAGKKELVLEALEFHVARPREEVRFIREDTFRELVAATSRPEHRLLLWLAWDIGENVSSLLQLRKQDFTQATNPYSNEPEYHVNLRREILKRSRTSRTEITNYRETVTLLDKLLGERRDEDALFDFGARMALKFLRRAVTQTGARCIPNGEPVTLKDLRSSMACDLLSKGWTTDEVNQRLGHKPSSREIDKYVNWLALGRQRPKRRLHDNQLDQLNQELHAVKNRESLLQQRQRVLQDEFAALRSQMAENNKLMYRQVVRLVREMRGVSQPHC